jgi:hypothetical protein
MKNLNRLLISLFLCLVAATAFAAPDVQGDYQLYRENQPNGPSVGSMNFFNQKGNDFLIAGSGWGATGHLNGSEGYYDWNFTDGRKGRTTFTVRSDGSLRGHVVGSNNDINWVYIARRTSAARPAAASPTARAADQRCNDCYDQQAVKTKGCGQMSDLMARNGCINDANAALMKCLDNCVP